MTSLRHLRSSTVNKRPDPAAMVDGQLAMNYDIASPGLFFKDDNGTLIKVGPVHVGTTAPNVSPAAGGTAGNSIGEQWLDTTSGVYVLKVWDGSAWRSESGTFVDVSGDTMTGALTMADQGAVRFSETTANGSNYIALQANAALASNKTITLPDTTGTVVTTGDTGTVTSTMIADDTILNADINASAAIAGTKISPDFGSQTVATTGIFSSAAGTATAPSIAFTGDLNTGIYSPGADQLAVATNGVGRLFVDAAGAVGIGAAPAAGTDIEVRNTGATARLRINSGTVSATSGTSSIDFVSAFSGSGVVGTARISGNAPAGGQSELSFLTSPTGNSPTERLRITSAGLVGIGTSAPGSLFHANGFSTTVNPVALGSNANAFSLTAGANAFGLTAGVLGAGAAYLQSGTTSGTGIAYSILLNPNGGNVGIGTTSPSSLLHLADAGNITVGTTTGTKIGTATTQKIGFFNKAPVVQPIAVADATDAATAITQLNALLARMRDLGLIAT